MDADPSAPPVAARSAEFACARNRTRGTIVARRVLWAGTSALRRKGLLGRDRLPPGEGIFLVPCQWVHTIGMRFSIDLAFLDRRGRVLALQRHLPPGRFSRLEIRADGVLELCSGALRESGTVVGDVLEWSEPED